MLPAGGDQQFPSAMTDLPWALYNDAHVEFHISGTARHRELEVLPKLGITPPSRAAEILAILP